jgi:drug/metabolite transporter (DMT)-like permease
MLGFSFTTTATRAAVTEMSSTFVGLGRAFAAGLLAVLVLAIRRDAWPRSKHFPALVRTAFGIVVGFPVLSALALRAVPASHAQVFLGLTPIATALMATLRFGERHGRWFWFAAAGGAGSILVFGWTYTGGGVSWPDSLLIAAVLLVGFGYAEGARLARELGGFRVIAWSLVFALPITLPVTLFELARAPWLGAASARAWAGFGYVSCISMFLAFLAWYRGLSLGGTARMSQVQLAMPVLGVLWAKLFLREELDTGTLVCGAFVVGFALLAQLAPRLAR